MAYFDLRTFIFENKLGAYAKLEGQKRDVDGDGDIDSDDYMAAKDQAIKKATTNEALGGEMAEMLGAFLALVGAGKTALEAVKILGDEHGDISISSIKDAIKQYKASKDMNEIGMFNDPIGYEKSEPEKPTYTKKFVSKDVYDIFKNGKKVKTVKGGEGDANAWMNDAQRSLGEDLSAEEEDKFHTKLDKLVHKTFGSSSDEKDMKEEMGMEYEYDDIVGPLMQNIVKMEKWVAQNASDDTEAVQLLQLATNAVENFDNYMAYGNEMNEEVKGDFKIGDKVTYLGHPGEVTNVERQMTGATTYSVAYDKGQGRTKVTGIYNKGGEIKPMKENSLNLSDAL